MPKRKQTKSRCNTCIHERVYPSDFIFPEEDRKHEHFYCGRLQEPLTFWQKLYNKYAPTYLDGSGATGGVKACIRHWIENHGDFSSHGRCIGKIIEPCPGYEAQED